MGVLGGDCTDLGLCALRFPHDPEPIAEGIEGDYLSRTGPGTASGCAGPY